MEAYVPAKAGAYLMRKAWKAQAKQKWMGERQAHRGEEPNQHHRQPERHEIRKHRHWRKGQPHPPRPFTQGTWTEYGGKEFHVQADGALPNGMAACGMYLGMGP